MLLLNQTDVENERKELTVATGKKVNRLRWAAGITGIKTNDKAVLMILAHHANHELLSCFPKTKTIYTEACITSPKREDTEKKLAKAINRLHEARLIATIPLFYTRTGKRAYTHYILNIDEWIAGLDPREILISQLTRQITVKGKGGVLPNIPASGMQQVNQHVKMPLTIRQGDLKQGLRLIPEVA